MTQTLAPTAGPLTLYADHEVGGRRLMGTHPTAEAAAEAVESLDESGAWPVGYDAVVTDAEGTDWLYVGDPGHEWER